MTRIDKRKARKMWKKGEEGFLIVACNLRPEYGMRYRKGWNNQFGGDFDKMVNNFTYYNCVNSETGRYPAFYVED